MSTWADMRLKANSLLRDSPDEPWFTARLDLRRSICFRQPLKVGLQYAKAAHNFEIFMMLWEI